MKRLTAAELHRTSDRRDYEKATSALASAIYYTHTLIHDRAEIAPAELAAADIRARARYVAEAILSTPRLLKDFHVVTELVDELRRETAPAAREPGVPSTSDTHHDH